MLKQSQQQIVSKVRTSSPTIQDVARSLGIHKSTVSLALSGKGNLAAQTRNQIRTVAREMGYEPNPIAQRLATGQNNNEVYIIGGLDLGVATEKLLLIQRDLTKHGLNVPVHIGGQSVDPDSRSNTDQVRQICRRLPRAIVCTSAFMRSPVVDELTRYQEAGGIVVTYDFPCVLDCDKVVFDREHNAYQATRYLLERGHRNIAIALDTQVFWLADEKRRTQPDRMAGYTKALREYELDVRDEFVFEHGVYSRGGAELASQYLASSNRPSAICIVNDIVALSFMSEVMRAGVRVPDDLSIIGMDGWPIAPFCPVPLTTADQPIEQIAKAVVDLLVERLNGESRDPRTTIIRGGITERLSVARLPLAQS